MNADLIPQGWKDYVSKTADLGTQYSNIIVGVLPDGRYGYYSDPNYDKIKMNVLSYMN